MSIPYSTCPIFSWTSWQMWSWQHLVANCSKFWRLGDWKSSFVDQVGSVELTILSCGLWCCDCLCVSERSYRWKRWSFWWEFCMSRWDRLWFFADTVWLIKVCSVCPHRIVSWVMEQVFSLLSVHFPGIVCPSSAINALFIGQSQEHWRVNIWRFVPPWKDRKAMLSWARHRYLTGCKSRGQSRKVLKILVSNVCILMHFRLKTEPPVKVEQNIENIVHRKLSATIELNRGHDVNWT